MTDPDPAPAVRGAPALPGPGSAPDEPKAAERGTARDLGGGFRDAWNGLTLAAVLLGAVLRGLHWAGRGAFWGDEAALGYNLLDRSFAGLARPLDLWQAAPVGFLWLEKATGLVLGMDERLLRLPPLMASIAGLAVVAWSARGLVGPRGAALATLLLTLSPELIRYGGELKPYSCDAALAAGLLGLIARAARRDETGDPRPLLLAGALAPWFSLPAVFVLAGCGGALLGRAILDRDRRGLLRLSAVAVAWAASFGAEYALCLRAAAREPELARYWASAFVPWPPTSPATWRWLAAKAVYLFEPVVGLPARHLALGLFLAGCAQLWRRDRTLLAMMAAVIAATLAASALGKYPFAGRLLLFLMPILILPIAVALAGLVRCARRPIRAIGWILLAALLLDPARTAATRLAADLRPDDSRARAVALFRTWKEEYRPGDRILIGRDADWFCRYYARSAGFDPPGAIHLIDRPTAGVPSSPARTWIFASSLRPDVTDSEADRLARSLRPSLRPTFRRDDEALGVSLRRHDPTP